MMLMHGFSDNVDPARRQELVDSRMIQEDPRAMANLPPQGIQRLYNPDRYVEKLAMYNQSNRWKR
jgi:hypothetical protein